MRSERLPALLFGALLAALPVVIVSNSVADPDLWGHIRFGQDTVRTGALSAWDPYSFTSDRPWVNHEWLAEVLMALSYRWAGTAGLLVLSCLCGVGAVLAAGTVLTRERVGRPARVALMALAFFGLSSQLRTVRPQMFSALLFALLLLVALRSERHSNLSLLYVFPIFAFWANVHGGWIVGLGVLGLWAGAAVVRRTISWRWAVTGVSLALLGSLVTPYRTGLWAFLWTTVGLGRNDIEDWQPLFRSPSHLLPWLLVCTAAVVALWQGLRRAGLRTTVLLALPVLALGLLTAKVYRLEGFFALSAVMLLAPIYAGLGPREWPLSRLPTRREIAVVGFVICAGLAVAFWAALRTTACLPLMTNERSTPEPDAIRFIQANNLRGRLLTWFDYGEYAIWYVGPGLRVSYDGRRETVYSDGVQKAHLRFYFSSADAGYARAIRADYVWLPRLLPVIPALERDHWTEIYRGPRSVILARAPGDYIDPGEWRGRRCFPGP